MRTSRHGIDDDLKKANDLSFSALGARVHHLPWPGALGPPATYAPETTKHAKKYATDKYRTKAFYGPVHKISMSFHIPLSPRERRCQSLSLLLASSHADD